MAVPNVPHVVNLVVDDPRNLSHHLASTVEHRSKDFGGHDEARGAGIDGDITRHEANIAEFLLKNQENIEAPSVQAHRQRFS